MRALDRVIAALDEHGGAPSNWLVGEPCVAPPEILREALARASRSTAFGYPPPAGRPELREILAALHGEGDRQATPDQVVVTHGAKGGLLAVLAALLSPGDELIHPRPCYPAYPAMAARLGARAVAVAENDGTFDRWAEAVAEKIGPRTRAVVLASPSNPTGATLTGFQAGALVDLCRERSIRLVCDEAYTEFRNQSAAERLPADFDPDRTTVVQVRSTSKSWALCGWRMGWVVADPSLAERVASQHAALLNPASGPAQEALTALPLVEKAYLEDSRSKVLARLEQLSSVLQACGAKLRPPAGGFYLWLDVSPWNGDGGTTAYCVDLARRHGVGLWPGEDFGGTGHVRLAVTTPPPTHWDEAVRALSTALSNDDFSDGV